MAEDRRQRLVKQKEAGLHAERVLNDPGFEDAKAKLEEAYVAGWKAAKQPADRESYWLRLQVLEEVLIALRTAKDAGKVADVYLKQMAEKA